MANNPDSANPDSANPAVSLVQVSKSYDDVEVLQSFDLQIAPGEFVVLLGPSGCGKSTILKLIAGLEEATEGEIHVAGQLVNYVRPRDRNVAMVFQNYALYPHMSVLDNIAFPLTMVRRPRLKPDVITERTTAAAEIVDLTAYLDRKPAQLSGGQRQRVALARAIVRQPAVFLMDEPLSNLDALLRADMRTSLLEIHQRIRRATLYVTHDQVEAMTMADRIVVLNAGRVQQIGSPDELHTTPASTFVARFIGSPRMPLHQCVGHDNGTLGLGPTTLKLVGGKKVKPGASVTVGLRPSDLRVTTNAATACLSGTVTRRDYLGSDIYLEVELPGRISISARAPAESSVRPGDLVHLAAAAGAIHVFDEAACRIGAATVEGQSP